MSTQSSMFQCVITNKTTDSNHKCNMLTKHLAIFNNILTKGEKMSIHISLLATTVNTWAYHVKVTVFTSFTWSWEMLKIRCILCTGFYRSKLSKGTVIDKYFLWYYWQHRWHKLQFQNTPVFCSGCSSSTRSSGWMLDHYGGICLWKNIWLISLEVLIRYSIWSSIPDTDAHSFSRHTQSEMHTL